MSNSEPWGCDTFAGNVCIKLAKGEGRGRVVEANEMKKKEDVVRYKKLVLKSGL